MLSETFSDIFKGSVLSLYPLVVIAFLFFKTQSVNDLNT